MHIKGESRKMGDPIVSLTPPPGERLPGITKARLLKATVIADQQRYERILQVKGICDKG